MFFCVLKFITFIAILLIFKGLIKNIFNFLYRTHIILGGVSNQNIELHYKERFDIITNIVPKEKLKEYGFSHSSAKVYENFEQYINKVNIAKKSSPIKRDLKIFRNSLKLLLKDIISIYKYKSYNIFYNKRSR